MKDGSWHAAAIALVRALVWLYPPRFRRRFGAGMVADFRERLAQRTSQGKAAAARLVFRTAADLAVSAAREWISPAGRGSRSDGLVPMGQGAARVLDDLRLDLRFALRSLRRRPGFTVVAVMTLALGVGANTAMFSAVNGVLLRPPALGDPSRLVVLWEVGGDGGGGVSQWTCRRLPCPGSDGLAAPASVFDWGEQVAAFGGVAGYGVGQSTLTGAGLPEVLNGARVTGNFFDVLGVRAARGRTFRPEETWTGASRVAVLSDGFWARRFGRDEGVIGSTIVVDDDALEVVGVLPPGAGFPDAGLDVWVPLNWELASRERRWFRIERVLRAIARLEDGVTLEQASAQLRAVDARRRLQHPEPDAASMRVGITPLQEFLAGDARAPLLILLGATGLLLLLTCANVANLLLVRAVGRDREIAVRAALGAGRGRVARQLLTESVVLALAGGVAGVVAALAGLRLLEVLRPPDAWRLGDVAMDARVLLFALGVTLASGVLFGLAPAARGASANGAAGLKDGGRTTGGKGSKRASQTMVVGEVALALLLATAAGLLLRSFVALRRVDPGFRLEERVAAGVRLSASRYETDARTLEFVDDVVRRLESVGGVRAVTYMSRLPFSGTTTAIGPLRVEGRGDEESGARIGRRAVAPNYFEVLGVPLLSGRAFAATDHAESEPVIIINEETARQVFGGEDAVGRRITWQDSPGAAEHWYRIVGVVGAEHQHGVHAPPQMEAFLSYRQLPSTSVNLVLHVPRAPAGLADAVRAAMAAADPLVAPYRFQSLEEIYATSLGRDRLLVTLVGAFAAVALLLASLGVYGVTAQTTARRTREIGVRIALGARAGDVARMILRQGLSLAAAGILLGLAGALAGAQVLASVLYGVMPRDALTFVAVPALLAVVAALASAIPALRAARLDPVSAMRRD